VCDHFSDRREASPYDDEVALVLTFSDVFVGSNDARHDPYSQSLPVLAPTGQGQAAAPTVEGSLFECKLI
jgi:hypothetical protein